MLNIKLSKEKEVEINNLETYPDTSNFVGKKFHHLTVIAKGPDYISPRGKRASRWWCICDCEKQNIILVRRSNLTSNNTKSCGCQNQISRTKNIKKAIEASKLDLSGQIFGELIAIKPTDKRKNNSVVWECLCTCGRTHYVAANQLKAHRIESCGCQTDSRGVRLIKKLLEQNNINYVTEKTFDTCKFTDTLQSARFDFYINNEFLLEYDGIQHFEDKEFFKDSLEKRQAHDLYKNQWCKKNNIPLKRIPYSILDNLTIETIMGDEWLV